ncbi:unnamed protein product [Diatraea saccharalis]|uniref:Uncharacterized protein n=1 Tax=Diatraea saccharalis TaxID=40085 RepID=A0A9N9R7F4_9NEOP|nr:unnamed protein product [Diatraea saccharalis]
MLPCPMDTIILPKGLANIGPGLGTKGKPLRDIVDQYKNFLKHKDSMVDTSIFLHSDSKDWNFESNDFKKSMSNISENSFNVDSLKVNKAGDVSFKRAVSFKTKNVEDTDDMHESPPPSKKSKFEPENNSREYQSIKSHERTDKPSWKSSEKDTSRNKIMQSSRNFQNLTVISQSSTGPARLKPESQSLNTNPPKNLNISKPPGTNDAPGVNMGSSVIPRMTFGAVLPRMPLNLSGPQGSNMGPCIGTPGVNMGPSCPPGVNMGPSGPPAMMNAPMGIMNSGPVEVNMGSIRMNMGPGPAPGVHMNTGPGGYGPPNLPPNSLRMNAPPQDSFELQFRNLPPSTTFPLLCEKISLCGQVLSLQLTTPGPLDDLASHQWRHDSFLAELALLLEQGFASVTPSWGGTLSRS